MSRKSKNKPGSMAVAEPPAGAASRSPAAAEVNGLGAAKPKEPMLARPDLPGPPARWWQKDWFIALLFFAAILLAYSHSLNGAFVWDDDKYISQNPDLRTLHGLWQIWFQPGGDSQYYPLSYTGFWLEVHLWGLRSTLGYHLVNVCLHTAVSVLLWQILKRLRVPGALLAGALFALHPVNVMSVAWMNEMKNTLSGSLALGAIWCYLRFEGLGVYAAAGKAKRAWGWYAAMAVLFILAMFAKTAVSFLPVSLLLIVWWQRERIGWREIWPLLPMVGIVAGMGIMTIHFEHKTAGAVGPEFALNFGQKIVISGHSFFFYLGKLFLPLNLTFVYTRWQINAWDWHQYFWPAAAAAVFAALWLLRRRIGKGVFAAAVHFYISTSFLIFMVVLYRMRYSFVSDHWQYFGSMSIFVLMGAGLAKGWHAVGGRDNRVAGSLAAGLLVLLGALTWYQCGMFIDLESLWHWSIDRNPDCWMAENNLGNELLDAGHVDDAMVHLRRAMAIKPDYVLAMNNYSRALIQKNDIDEASALLKKALAIQPGNAETLNNLGGLSEIRGHVAEAIDYYHEALDSDPDNAFLILVRNHLAGALLHEGRVGDALEQYEKEIEVMPDYVPALNNVAYLLATSRDSSLRNGAKAVEFARKAVQLSGGRNAVAIDTLAAAYAEEGLYPQAVDIDWKAIARALDQKDTAHADLFRKHLELYQTRQPLRDK